MCNFSHLSLAQKKIITCNFQNIIFVQIICQTTKKDLIIII